MVLLRSCSAFTSCSSKPLTANFYVLKISLRGAVRSSPPGILIGDDFPTAQELACANDDGKFMHPINAELFSDTYLCKFGPLKVRMVQIFFSNSIL